MTADVRPPGAPGMDDTTRVLLFGYINTNVIDGSALFLAGAAALFAEAGNCRVSLVTAVPLARHEVLNDVLDSPMVEIVDPFRDETLEVTGGWRADKRMSHADAARVLLAYWSRGEHDLIFVRSTEVAEQLVDAAPEIGRNLLVYVTGVAFSDRPVAPTTSRGLKTLARAGAILLAQTEEMRTVIGAEVGNEAAARIGLMGPAVPWSAATPLPLVPGLRLAYTGKFAPAWNTVPILAGVLEAHARHDDVSLVVAGDYFKRDSDDPRYADEAQWLLGRPGVDWIGGVSRSRARQEVLRSHVGIGWRSPALDHSLELSTKILEYGMLGRPSIINRTPMHERIFGSDYPLYCESFIEFIELIETLREDHGLLESARERMAQAAGAHTYERVFAGILSDVLVVSRRSNLDPERSAALAAATTHLADGTSRETVVADYLVAWATSRDDIRRLATQIGQGKLRADLAYVGPFAIAPLASEGEESSDVDALEVLWPRLEFVASRQLQARRATSSEDGDASATTLRFDIRGRVSKVVLRSVDVGGSGASTTKTAEQLQRHVSELQERRRREVAAYRELRARYERLRSSKAVRIQSVYWRAVSRLRGSRKQS